MTTSIDLGGTPPETDADNRDVRKSRLRDGSTISIRPDSSGGKPIMQITGPRTGGKRPPHIKVRYNTHGE